MVSLSSLGLLLLPGGTMERSGFRAPFFGGWISWNPKPSAEGTFSGARAAAGQAPRLKAAAIWTVGLFRSPEGQQRQLLAPWRAVVRPPRGRAGAEAWRGPLQGGGPHALSPASPLPWGGPGAWEETGAEEPGGLGAGMLRSSAVCSLRVLTCEKRGTVRAFPGFTVF